MAPQNLSIAKLPKWAQEYIHDLTLQRDLALRNLKEFEDQQTEQPFSQLVHTLKAEGGGGLMRRYIHGHSISAKWAGIDLDITLTQDDGIRISFASEKSALSGGACIIPQAGNSIFIREVEFTKPAPGQKGR